MVSRDEGRSAAGFSPKETWLKHIRNGHYLTWPHITVKNVNKYFPESEETQKGHMRNVRQGVRSTKTLPIAALPITPHIAKYIFISVYDPRATIFTDQTGKFPLQSSRRNHHQMVVHDIDSNSTWVEPMKNRTEGDMILSRRRSLSRMKLRSIIPKHQVLDNEISDAYRTEIRDTNVTFQLVPPDDHRRNLAERTIQ